MAISRLSLGLDLATRTHGNLLTLSGDDPYAQKASRKRFNQQIALQLPISLHLLPNGIDVARRWHDLALDKNGRLWQRGLVNVSARSVVYTIRQTGSGGWVGVADQNSWQRTAAQRAGSSRPSPDAQDATA